MLKRHIKLVGDSTNAANMLPFAVNKLPSLHAELNRRHPIIASKIVDIKGRAYRSYQFPNGGQIKITVSAEYEDIYIKAGGGEYLFAGINESFIPGSFTYNKDITGILNDPELAPDLDNIFSKYPGRTGDPNKHETYIPRFIWNDQNGFFVAAGVGDRNCLIDSEQLYNELPTQRFDTQLRDEIPTVMYANGVMFAQGAVGSECIAACLFNQFVVGITKQNTVVWWTLSDPTTIHTHYIDLILLGWGVEKHMQYHPGDYIVDYMAHNGLGHGDSGIQWNFNKDGNRVIGIMSHFVDNGFNGPLPAPGDTNYKTYPVYVELDLGLSINQSDELVVSPTIIDASGYGDEDKGTIYTVDYLWDMEYTNNEKGVMFGTHYQYIDKTTQFSLVEQDPTSKEYVGDAYTILTMNVAVFGAVEPPGLPIGNFGVVNRIACSAWRYNTIWPEFRTPGTNMPPPSGSYNLELVSNTRITGWDMRYLAVTTQQRTGIYSMAEYARSQSCRLSASLYIGERSNKPDEPSASFSEVDGVITYETYKTDYAVYEYQWHDATQDTPSMLEETNFLYYMVNAVKGTVEFEPMYTSYIMRELNHVCTSDGVRGYSDRSDVAAMIKSIPPSYDTPDEPYSKTFKLATMTQYSFEEGRGKLTLDFIYDGKATKKHVEVYGPAGYILERPIYPTGDFQTEWVYYSQYRTYCMYNLFME